MSRELFKSMVYKDGHVYTRQCSNNVWPKDFTKSEHKYFTKLYQEKGQQDFEKFFIANALVEGNVHILSNSNKILQRLNNINNLLWNDKEFIKLKNKECEIWEKAFQVKTEDEKNIVNIDYNNINNEIKNRISIVYDNYIKKGAI